MLLGESQALLTPLLKTHDHPTDSCIFPQLRFLNGETPPEGKGLTK